MATNKFKVGDTAIVINTRHGLPSHLVGEKVRILWVKESRVNFQYGIWSDISGGWFAHDDNFGDRVGRQLEFEFMRDK